MKVPEHQATVLKSNPRTPWDALDSSTERSGPFQQKILAAQDGANNLRRARGAGAGASKGSTCSIKGVREGEWQEPGEHRGSFVCPSQRCSVPALAGQMAGQHLLVRQEADKKYVLSPSQRAFSSSFFFQSVECVQSIISAWE